MDDSRGAALLTLFQGQGVTIRAWAYGDQWIGAGTVRDVELVVRPVLDAYLDLNQGPWADLRKDGLLIWAGTEHEDLYCWRTDDGDPDRWPVVVRTVDGQFMIYRESE